MKLYGLTAHEMSDLLRSRKVSAVELTKSILDRIDKVDPKVGSYITVLGDEAVKRAEEVQKKIDNGEAKSPLAGVPFALKDNICTENIRTTCASKMLHNYIPPYNATVYSKLMAEDAVLIGKLNMDEFGMCGSTENSHFKITRNPWDTQRVSGGSGGGSAAAVAAELAGFSLGSDTGGSIRQSAAFCGVVGIKPTYGAVSRYGLVASASSLDQIGPITKDVTDCALVLNAITGYDQMDSTSIRTDYPDYTKALVNHVKGLKVGIPKEYIGEDLNGEVRKAVLDVIEILKKLGAECEEFQLPVTEYAIPAYCIISSAEASSNLARYDGIKYGYRTEKFTNLMDMYKQSRGEGFGTEVKRRIILGTYALSSGCYHAYYEKALRVRTFIKNGFDEAFKKYDVVLGPTAPTTAYKVGEKVDNPLEMHLEDIYTVSANMAGLPGLAVPCGLDSAGLPVGIQLIGKPLDESILIRIAYTIEQNIGFDKNKARV